MRGNLRLFLVGGLISYRALFNWIHPSIYIPTMLGSPLFQVLFFAYLGRFSGVRDDTFFVVGNALQISAMAGIYGATMALANERWMGTLAPLLATPANRGALVLGRTIPYIVNGLFVSAFGFAVGYVFLDFRIEPGSMPLLGVIAAVTVLSCTSLGLLLGAVGLRARDVFFVSNLAYFLMLLFCGVNVPLDVLPNWMRAIGENVPLTNGIAAAREVVGGATLAAVRAPLLKETVVGVLFAAGAFALFRFFELQSRRTASLETR